MKSFSSAKVENQNKSHQTMEMLWKINVQNAANFETKSSRLNRKFFQKQFMNGCNFSLVHAQQDIIRFNASLDLYVRESSP